MKAEEAFNLGKDIRDKQSKKDEEFEQSSKELFFQKIMKDIEKNAKRGLTSIKYKSNIYLLFLNSKIDYLIYDGGIDTLEEIV